MNSEQSGAGKCSPCSITNAEINGLIATIQSRASRAADRKAAAKKLIDYYAARFEEGADYNEQLFFQFISEAFKGISKRGLSADQAFGLAPERGRPQRDTTERDIAITAFIVLERRREKATTFDSLYQAAANKFHLSKERIRQIYDYYEYALATVPDQYLEECAAVIN